MGAKRSLQVVHNIKLQIETEKVYREPNKTLQTPWVSTIQRCLNEIIFQTMSSATSLKKTGTKTGFAVGIIYTTNLSWRGRQLKYDHSCGIFRFRILRLGGFYTWSGSGNAVTTSRALRKIIITKQSAMRMGKWKKSLSAQFLCQFSSILIELKLFRFR